MVDEKLAKMQELTTKQKNQFLKKDNIETTDEKYTTYKDSLENRRAKFSIVRILDKNLLPNQNANVGKIVFSKTMKKLVKFKKEFKEHVVRYLCDDDKDEKLIDDYLELQDIDMYKFLVVKLCLEIGFERKDHDRKSINMLIEHLSERNYLSQRQVFLGYYIVASDILNYELDYPNVIKYVDESVLFSEASDSLDPKFCARVIDVMQFHSDQEFVKEIKIKLNAIVKHYFVTEDLAEAAQSIDELNCISSHHELVKIAISLSFDRKEKERTLVSQLLAAVASDIVDLDEIAKGFDLILKRAEDFEKDVPNVLEYVSKFIAQAVADEIIAPSFLLHPSLMEKDLGYKILKHAISNGGKALQLHFNIDK